MIIDKNGFYITKKEASIGLSTLVILALLIFIAGYFWGKRHVIDGFTQKASQESFNDQADYLLTMQTFASKTGTAMPTAIIDSTDTNEQEVETDLESLPDATEECDTVKTDTVVNPAITVVEQPTISNAIMVSPVAIVETSTMQAPDNGGKKSFIGLLAGFARKDYAERMQFRLKKKKINVEIKKRVSHTASGKVHKAWYQVVTCACDSKQKVEEIIASVMKYEKIKKNDIKIIESI